jgi:hypothetical protein
MYVAELKTGEWICSESRKQIEAVTGKPGSPKSFEVIKNLWFQPFNYQSGVMSDFFWAVKNGVSLQDELPMRGWDSDLPLSYCMTNEVKYWGNKIPKWYCETLKGFHKRENWSASGKYIDDLLKLSERILVKDDHEATYKNLRQILNNPVRISNAHRNALQRAFDNPKECYNNVYSLIRAVQVKDDHRQASYYSQNALVELHKNKDPLKAIELYKLAYELEGKAALHFLDKRDKEPTRSVLFRSAGWLAYKSGNIEAAKIMVAHGLDGTPPNEIKMELTELQEAIAKLESGDNQFHNPITNLFFISKNENQK